MPVYNFTIPFSSPIIQYTGEGYVAAVDVLHFKEPGLPNISLSFMGTDVYWAGIWNVQGCNFLADLDGNVTRQSIPFYPGVVSTSQEPIFSSTGLARDTLHTLRLSSFLPEPYCSGFQFTGVNITTGDADPSTQAATITIDAASTGNVTFDDSWSSSPDHTLMQTGSYNGSANIFFFGNAISVYGMAGPENGPYNVTLDGTRSAYNGSAQTVTPNALLYFNGDLSSDSMHHLILTNDDYMNHTLVFTSAIVSVYSKASAGAIPSHTTQPVASHVSMTAIAGAVGGGTLAVLLAVAVILLLRRRRRRPVSRPHVAPYKADMHMSSSDDHMRLRVPSADEIDMPPPNYQHVFPTTDSESRPPESSAPTRITGGLAGTASRSGPPTYPDSNLLWKGRLPAARNKGCAGADNDMETIELLEGLGDTHK